MLAPGGNVSVWEEECRRRVDTANRRLRLKWHVAYEKSVLSQQTIQDLQCDAEMLEAKKGQNRHLVIASNQSFYNKVIQPALMRRQCSQSTYETNQEARHPITWSIMGWDEYHLAKAITTLPSQYFFVAQTCSERAERSAPNPPWNCQVYQPQPHQDDPLQIAMTRMPFEGSPIDLAGHINRIPSPKCISNDRSMARCNPNELRWYSQIYIGLVVSINQGQSMDPRLMGRAKKYSKDLNQFLSKFMICWTIMSKFFDLPLSHCLRWKFKNGHAHLTPNTSSPSKYVQSRLKQSWGMTTMDGWLDG